VSEVSATVVFHFIVFRQYRETCDWRREKDVDTILERPVSGCGYADMKCLSGASFYKFSNLMTRKSKR